MNTLIFDALSRRCIGSIDGDKAAFNGDGVLLDVDMLPEGLNLDDLASLFLSDDGVSVTQDTTVLLERTKAARKTRIKSEAALMIEALDWRLARARERAEAGVTGVETVADVLAMREAIRVSSSQAEAAVNGLTDLASVQTFTWAVN
ncbi:MAG: hypothetical protein RIR18_1597 [Pseudomonadota bacterium]|jgi:hypothetical protein